jgi:uncharacterized membrane protein (UPF0127 family)
MARSSVGILTAIALAVAVGACRADPWVSLGGERFQVEVATTPEEQARGLMFRDELPADQGMLFVYDREGPRSFWMKNTLIPLDILFFDGNRRLINWHTANPCHSDPCPGYSGDAPARYVLELNAGTAAELELKSGDRMELHIDG